MSWWRDDSFDLSGRDVVDEPGDTQPAREGFASIVFVAVGWCGAGVCPPAGSGATGRPAAKALPIIDP